MKRRANAQPEAGRLIRAHREAHGLGVQDFCDLVSKQSTEYGRVNLDRTGLWRIEEEGLVPLPPRRWAIARVISTLTKTRVTPGDLWHTPGSRMVSALIPDPQQRKAA